MEATVLVQLNARYSCRQHFSGNIFQKVDNALMLLELLPVREEQPQCAYCVKLCYII